MSKITKKETKNLAIGLGIVFIFFFCVLLNSPEEEDNEVLVETVEVIEVIVIATPEPTKIVIPTSEPTPEVTEEPTPTATATLISTLVPTAIPQPTLIPIVQPTSPPPGNCDYNSYPDFCIAPYPPDLNCSDIPHKNFKVNQPDPHGFDRDKDGLACEG